MKHVRRALVLPLLLTLLGALVGCADASTNGRDSYNQTDVTFATELIHITGSRSRWCGWSSGATSTRS